MHYWRNTPAYHASYACAGDPKQSVEHKRIKDSMCTYFGKNYVIKMMNSIVLKFFDCYLKGKASFNSAGTPDFMQLFIET